MSYGGPLRWTSDITYNRLNGAIRHRIPPESFSFSSSEAGSSFACRLEQGGFAPCVSPKTYGVLSDGRHDFAVPIDWRLVRGFAGDVLRATARIPFGAVSSYRQVAAEAGSPNAYRAAGNALGSNPIPIVVPCHRVLHAGGSLGGYTGGLDRKRYLLRLEGVLDG